MPPSSGDLTVQLLTSKLEGMQRVDSTGQIELAIAKALNAGPGEKKLMEELEKMLPSGSQHVTINESVNKLNDLGNSALAKFCSVATQQKVQEILAALRAIQRGHSPAFTTWGGDVFLKKIKDETIPLFLFVEDGGASSSGDMPVRGKEAAMHHLQAAREAHGDGSLHLAQLQVLTTYDFLLSPSENELVQTWLSEIWKSAGLAGATAINDAKRAANPSSSSAGAPRSRMRHSNQPEAETVDNIANLFA